MNATPGGVLNCRSRAQLAALLKVQAKLSLREPYGLGLGVGLPAVLLVVFGFISQNVPGNVGGSGLTVIDLYVPTLMVISFIAIAISLPNSLVKDREIGWLRRISTTPVHPSRLLAAQLILDLPFAAAAIVIVIAGGQVIFGAPLSVGIPYFILSLALAIAEIFSLGLVVVALARTQTVASAVGSVLFFGVLYLSGLWVQPLQIGTANRRSAKGHHVVLAERRGGAVDSLLGVPRNTPGNDPDRSQRMTARAYLGATALLAVGVAVAACASSSTSASAPTTVTNPSAAKPAGSWPYPNGDPENTRDAAGSTISSANVASLQQAWTFKLPAAEVPSGPSFGSMAATPIVANGVAYMQDLGDNVYALALATGKLKWEYKVSPAKIVEGGPNGVAVAGGVVYGDTMTTVFALSARTGKAIWVDRDLLSKGQGTFGIQPQVANGSVYLASSIGTGPSGGVLLALQASTGKVPWRFNTLLHGSASRFGAGGAWEPPLVGSDGSVTFGIGNPYHSAAQAIGQPGPQLYTDSEVNLDAATGRLRWYYQGVANDFMDHDMQTSPIAAVINGQPAIIGSGKMGVVYAMNARTGKLIWKTPVGEHSISDNYPLEAMQHKLTLNAPYTILPGGLGGLLSNPALAGNTVYVATVDLPFRLAKMSYPLGAPDGDGTGEIEALNLTTGKVEWDTKVPAMPLGATTVSNDLIFTTLYTGVLIALNRNTGAIVYQHKLPTSANAPIAIAGNTILVPAGGPSLYGPKGGSPQLVAYTVR